MPLTKQMFKFDARIKTLLVQFLLKHVYKIGICDDPNGFAILFFSLSGLDLINSLDEISEEKKKTIIELIYRHQLKPIDKSGCESGKFGFGCKMMGESDSKYEFANLAVTFCALASLIILGDDLSRINRRAILQGLKGYQQDDGRFIQALVEEEDDIRITFCAATICFILDDWSFIDKRKMISFIKSCQSYENGFGQKPGTEAHGGSTFCALASLYLMGQLDQIYPKKQRHEIAEWCIRRQISGFQGRSHKVADSCYSFWIGATLTFLDSYNFVNDKENCDFLQSTYDGVRGGFGKHADVLSDIMHTHFALEALSLRIFNKIHGEVADLQSLFPALLISERAYKHLMSIHAHWEKNELQSEFLTV